MATEKIKVTIQPNGEIQVETIGMKGEKCLDTIDWMEQLLEAETVDSAYTAEYYEQPLTNDTTVNNELRGRS